MPAIQRVVKDCRGAGSQPRIAVTGLVSLRVHPGDGVRGRYGDLGGVPERCGFRVSVRARERDCQLGGPAFWPVVPVEGNWWLE